MKDEVDHPRRRRAAALLAGGALAVLAAPGGLGGAAPPGAVVAPAVARGGAPWAAPEVALAHHFGIDRRARRIAAAFKEILLEFRREQADIGPPSESSRYVDAADDLIERTLGKAVAVLDEEGYRALVDWLEERSQRARAGLGGGGIATETRPPRPPAPAVALASLRPAAGPPQNDAGGGEGWLAFFGRALELIFVRAEARCLDIEVGLTVEGVDRASMSIHLLGNPLGGRIRIRANDRPQRVRIGLYAYDVEASRRLLGTCDVAVGDPLEQCPLDLATHPVRGIDCDFTAPGAGECFYGVRHGHCSASPP